MKKNIAAGLGILLAASLVLSGCAMGGGSDKEDAGAQESEIESEEGPEDGEEPPAMPGGEEPPEKPDGEEPPEKPDGAPPDGEGGPGGPGGAPGEQKIEYDPLLEYDSDAEEKETDVESTYTDEVGILVRSGNVKLTDYTVSRQSSDSTGGDIASFYGVGAAVLNIGGTLEYSDSEINTDAKGGTGVFSYGKNAETTVNRTRIFTRQDTSGGIHVAGGGTLYANDVTVETNGESSAAIRSDRGGGTMVVNGGSYTSNGVGSPAIYSTADITVTNADLIATNSEAICIEGKNSVRLNDCYLKGDMHDDERNDCTWNIILYQSMSGDAEEGKSTFEMTGGAIEQGNGGLFYTTNTQSEFVLDHVGIIKSEDSEFLLKCTGNSNARGWGNTGSNGAKCKFKATNQILEGNIIWDSISGLDIYLTSESYYWGAVMRDETNAGEGGSGYCAMNVNSGCQWIVTGDSYVTYLHNAGDIIDSAGNTVSIFGTDGNIYAEGDSNYSILTDIYTTEPEMG